MSNNNNSTKQSKSQWNPSSSQPEPMKQDDEQPLKRSTYNIFEAYDNDMPVDYSLLASSSIHPLQTQDSISPYSFDMSPTQPQRQHANPNPHHQGDLNSMMQDLNLDAPPSNNIEMQRSTSMPYCV